MPHARPELVFVSGPQEGRHAVLMDNIVLAGRSASCDVQITEQYVSREHLRFELTADGWQIEALSPRGMRINDRKYKRRKKMLLDTGDVLGIGAATEMLFVSPGDDPAEVLAAYRAEHVLPPAEEPEQPASESPEAPVPPAGPAAGPGPEEQLAEPQPQPQPEAPEDESARRRKAKMKKYAVFFGVYAVVFVAGVILIACFWRDDVTPVEKLVVLSDEEIAEALDTPYERPMLLSRAAEELTQAKNLFEYRSFPKGNLYRCVKSFKLHLAYRKSLVFTETRDTQDFRTARNELVAKVQREYRNAYKDAQAGNWRRAEDRYHELLDIVPETDSRDPVHKKLVKNINDHLNFVQEHIKR